MQHDIDFLDDATRPEPPVLDVTPAQRRPGLHLKMIHDHLRESVDQLGQMIDDIAAGQRSAADVAAEAGGIPALDNYRRFGNLCGQYCLFVNGHHSIEDAHIFPALGSKSATMKAISDRLKAEHDVVHGLLVRLVDSLNALAETPGADQFDRVRADFDTLRGILLSHLTYEEAAIGDALGYYEVGV
jgi:hypothetical protein